MTDSVTAPLKKTPRHSSHVALGARMVPFGGWDMPVEYSGITAEHMAVRTAAGLFDVSHMGQLALRPKSGQLADAALALERLVPVLMTALSAGIALIPLLLSAHEPGKEILHPVAVVMVGGLVSSTLLDLMVTPAVFYLFGRKAALKYLQPNPTNP